MTSDAKFWNHIAHSYAAKPVNNIAAFERKKIVTRELLRPDSNVLEIGCGTGSLALEMARYAGHIHALDISSEMIRIARAKQETQRIANVTFEQGSLEQSSIQVRAHFDAVWAYSLLHLVPDRVQTLQTIFALLRPGGWFIASHVCLGDTWIPYGPFITVARWFGKAPRVHIYGRETMFRELRDAGFVDVQERDVGAAKTVAFTVARKP